jgi:hypothetical protein
MSEVTRILNAIEQGEPQVAEQLLPLVYDELRQLAAQKLGQEKTGAKQSGKYWSEGQGVGAARQRGPARSC